MKNPVAPLVEKHVKPLYDKHLKAHVDKHVDMEKIKRIAKTFAWRMKEIAIGIAHDFWKDGAVDDNGVVTATTPPRRRTYAEKIAEGNDLRWHAEAGELEETMWGKGFVLPGGDVILAALTEPLKLTKDSNVLDLSAGLGASAKVIADKYSANITALDPNQRIAARGQIATVYDPNNFTGSGAYDAIVAREIFYRVTDKHKFFTGLSVCAKPGAQLSFTDFLVNPEDQNNAAVQTWRAYEKATPLGLVGMAEAWAKAGFQLNFHEDRTEFYRKEIPNGLKRLAIALASGAKPDAETKKMLMHSLQLWTVRLAAIEQGLKFYRFYGLKQ